jgi:hypothetical protein
MSITNNDSADLNNNGDNNSRANKKVESKTTTAKSEDGSKTTTTTVETETEVKPGLFGRLFGTIARNPVKSTVVVAAVGTGAYFGYKHFQSAGEVVVATSDVVEESAEVAVETAAAFFGR